MSAPGFFDTLERQLGDRLERTVARRRARRRVAERVAGFGVGAVAIVATVFFATNNEAEAGVSVQTNDGLVYLRLLDDEHDADEIQSAAAAAGIAIEVEAVPVGPSLVGRFVGAGSSDDSGLGELKELDLDGPAFSGFVIPAGYDGTIFLQVGRPAEAGEPYVLDGNAVSEGEPLACSGVLAATPSEALAIATERDLQVTWIRETGSGPAHPTDAEIAGGAHDDDVIVNATTLGPSEVRILIAPADLDLPAARLTSPAAC